MVKNSSLLPWQQPEIIKLSDRIFNSFEYWLKRPLIEVGDSPEEIAQALFEAPFALMAHGTEADPIFSYGNRFALESFGFTWETFTKMPSRYSAEPVEREERERLLQESQRQGFTPYQVVRVTRTGQRFLIEDGILWNLLDDRGQYCGQAATYSQWTPLE
ncbi:MAG: MEKHLA domain-containing protein [Oscillatoria sp. SIO1A7]|nr:MEKHLA domain-containing protein [Oscillatoria sp. SIO1A7]